MTGILKQLKWESLKKSRKGNLLILLYKGLKGKARIPTGDVTLSPTLGVAEINIPWHFKYPLLVLKHINVVFILRPSGTGMSSLIPSAALSDDCVSKFSSLVRARDKFFP